MINYVFVSAGVSELADEADSKSVFRKEVWVQVPSPAYIISDGFKVYAPLRSALSGRPPDVQRPIAGIIKGGIRKPGCSNILAFRVFKDK